MRDYKYDDYTFFHFDETNLSESEKIVIAENNSKKLYNKNVTESMVLRHLIARHFGYKYIIIKPEDRKFYDNASCIVVSEEKFFTNRLIFKVLSDLCTDKYGQKFQDMRGGLGCLIQVVGERKELLEHLSFSKSLKRVLEFDRHLLKIKKNRLSDNRKIRRIFNAGAVSRAFGEKIVKKYHHKMDKIVYEPKKGLLAKEIRLVTEGLKRDYYILYKMISNYNHTIINDDMLYEEVLEYIKFANSRDVTAGGNK